MGAWLQTISACDLLALGDIHRSGVLLELSWRLDTKALVSDLMQGLPCFLAHPESPVSCYMVHFALHILSNWLTIDTGLNFSPALSYSVWVYFGVLALSVDIPGTLVVR